MGTGHVAGTVKPTIGIELHVSTLKGKDDHWKWCVLAAIMLKYVLGPCGSSLLRGAKCSPVYKGRLM
jgi:hypothetical protein